MGRTRRSRTRRSRTRRSRTRSESPRRQRILITGASSGLGAQMARIWAADGRDLVLCARRDDALVELRDELLAAHPGIRVLVRRLDVTERSAVRATFAEAIEELGGLDRVVVNAGIGAGRPVGVGSGDANLATAQTNFLGALHQTEAALAHFRAVDAGHLVIVASMASLRGLSGSTTVYGATKAAVASLGEGLRSEFWDSPISVTTLFPGYIKTEMTDKASSTPLLAPLESATAELVRAVDAERARAYVPAWPWAPLSVAMRLLPLPLIRRWGG